MGLDGVDRLFVIVLIVVLACAARGFVAAPSRRFILAKKDHGRRTTATIKPHISKCC